MAGFGATVLGYAHPEVDAAASEAQARCEMIPTVHFSFPSPLFSCQGNVHRVDGVAVASLTAHVDVYLIVIETISHHKGNGEL